jgi:hypothetical protein
MNLHQNEILHHIVKFIITTTGEPNVQVEDLRDMVDFLEIVLRVRISKGVKGLGQG